MPLFAFEMDGQTLIGLLGGVGAACTAVGAGAWKVWDRWDKGRDGRRKTQLEDDEIARKKKIEDDQRNTDYWKDIVNRLDAQNQKSQKENDDCHKRVSKLSQVVVYFYGVIRDQGREIERLGGKFTEMEELSNLIDDPDLLAFAHNNTKQGSILLHEEARVATSPPGAGAKP